MKFSTLVLIILGALLLAACNFTLAEDITPPPDYVPPTPMPTLGALYPASAPDVQAGASLFGQHCAACHGTSGLGDGPQSMQLPVTVPGIGLPEVARGASPASWFKTVTQGNLDRFMPPFAGALTDTERWDVVAYALSLHTPPDMLERGRSLVETACSQCSSAFSNLERMASLSESDLVGLIRNGEGDVPPFAKDFSEDDAYAAAAYLRTLTFAEPAQMAAAATLPAGTAPAGGASSPGTPFAPASSVGTVSGSVKMGAADKLEGITITLHGFDHSTDPSAGPQEILTVSSHLEADGTYTFENVDIPENRIFLADVTYAGITYRSEFKTAAAGDTSITLPSFNLYEPSTDIGLLSLDQVHIYTDFATPGTVQVIEIFAFSNKSDKAVIISTDGNTIPFIQIPAGATGLGYEAGQDSASFVAADQGLAVVPGEKPYSIIAFFSLAFDKSLDFQQPIAIDAPSILLLVPDGIKVVGSQLASEGMQLINNNNYQEFSAADLKSGDTLSFTVSGRPKVSSATGLSAHKDWLIGGAALGLALIFGGIFLYWRERRAASESAEVGGEFDSSEEVLDAILALDDLHRAGKISDVAYQTRRAELKEILKSMS